MYSNIHIMFYIPINDCMLKFEYLSELD